MTRKTPSSPELGGGKKALALLIGKLCGIAAVSNASYAGPAGGVVTAGEGTISTPTTTSTVIDQGSNRLSVDWQSFDVASNESVRFNQPTSNSVAINRILDQKASEVFGRIDANGRVVLFNSNGIMFGPGSQVNVGSLLATSLNVVSYDESTGKLRLSATGTPGAIINNGTLSAASGGSVSLVGGAVSNNGLIVADLGSVNLAAGRSATLDFYGGGLLRFDADSSLTENASGAAAGVSNSGQISANGGQVLLTTSAVQNVFALAVNNDGLVRANRIENSGGVIRLMGEGGTVINSGELDASGIGAGSTGGSVQVLGENVGLLGSAVVDVSGDAGGGTVLLGGDYQGANPGILNANQTIVGPDAQVLADARVSGNGGRVILWSEDGTRFYGSISARGGSESGNGGFAEVSSHGLLGFGGSVNLGAPAGSGGQLLLDPVNIFIEATGPQAPNLDFGDMRDVDATVGADDIELALNTASVTLSARTDIEVNAPIVGTGANNGIALRAGDDIEINANITTNNGNILLSANDSGGGGANPPVGAEATGDVRFDDGMTLDVGTTGDITITSEGSVALGSLVGDVISVTSTLGSVTQDAAATLTGNSLTVSAQTAVNIDTEVDTLTSGTATTGLLDINNTGALLVTSASGVGVTLRAVGGNLTLDAVDSGTGAASVTSTTGTVTQSVGGIVSGASLTVSGTSVDLETNVDTLTSGTATTGSLQINNSTTDPLSVVSATGVGVNITTGGNLTIDTVTAGAGDANVVADGAMLDDNDQTSTISGANVTLTADSMGTITNLANGTGSSIDIDTAGNLVAGLNTANGDMNLNLVQVPDVAAGAISLDDDGGPTSGRILLQTPVAFDLTTFAPGSIYLGASSSAQVGLRSGDVLTLPNLTTSIFDGLPTTFAVSGTNDVVDDDGPGLSFTIANLIFNSGTTGATDLTTTLGTLTATVGGDLNVTETNTLTLTNIVSGGAVDVTAGANIVATRVRANGGGLTLDSTGGAIALTDVEANGNIDVDATGNITAAHVTALNANDVDLNSSAGRIVDAVEPGARTYITGDDISLAGISIGSTATQGEIDVNASILHLSASGGDVVVLEADGAGISDFAASGGAITQIETETGGMSLNTNLTPTSGNVRFVTRGSTAADYSANIIGSGAVGSTATVLSGGNLAVGQILADNVVLEAGFESTPGGNLVLDNINGNYDSVSMSATGSITDVINGTASVTSDLLTITGASLVNIETNVNSLDASGVAGNLTVRELTGALTVIDASATAGAANRLVNISTANGALSVENALGTGVTLNAGGAAGDLTITGLVDSRSGPASLTAGRAMVATAAGADITGVGAMTLNAGTTMSVGTVNAGNLNTATISLTSNGAMSVRSLIAQNGTVTLQAGAGNAISDGAGVSVLANRLNISNSGSADLNTTVGILNANVAGPLNISETNALTVEAASATNGAVNVSTGAGAMTVTSAAATGGSVTLTSTGGGLTVTSATSSTGAVTLTSNGAGNALNVANASGTSANLTSGGAMSVTGTLGAGTGVATLSSGSTMTLGTVNAGSASLTSNGAMTLGRVNANTTTGTVTLAAGSGAITDAAGTTPSVVANQLTITGAGSANLDTDVNTLNAGAVANSITGALTVRDQNTGLSVTNANANGAVNVSTTGGTMAVAAASSGAALTLASNGAGNALNVTNASGTSANLTSGGAMSVTGTLGAGTGVATLSSGSTLTLGTVNAGSASLTSNGAMALGRINANTTTGTVTLAAGSGAITDAAGTTPSVVANQLAITGAGSANLDTSVNILNAGAVANSITGALTVRDQTAGLSVTNANANGAVSVSTTGGTMAVANAASGAALTLASNGAGNALNVANASGTSANLTSGGAMSVTGTLAATTGAATLSSGDTLTTTLGTVSANAASGSVSMTSVGAMTLGSVSAGNGVTLSTGAGSDLTVSTVSAGAGAATLTAGDELLDDDEGTLSTSSISGASVALAAVNGIGSVTNFGTAEGSSVDVNTSGPLTALVTSSSGAINLNIVGAPAISTDGITLGSGTGRDGIVVLQSANDLNLENLDAGAINIGSGNTASVGFLSGGTLTLRDTGTTTDFRPSTLTVTGADIMQGGTRNIDIAAGTLFFTATAPGGAVTLNTSVGTLNADVTPGVDLTIVDNDAGLALGRVVAQTVALQAVGAVSDAAGATASIDADQLTVTGATSLNLDTDLDTLDVSGVSGNVTVRDQAGNLVVTNASATGAVNVSTAAGALNVTDASGNGVTLNAGGAGSGLTLGSVNAGTGTATLSAGGAISDGAGVSVVAEQLTISSADSANLNTNVNVLDASNVSNALTIAEASGPLTVANASATGPVTISTVDGAMSVTSAASGGALSLTTGGTGALTVANASGTSANLTSGGAMSVTGTLGAGTGQATLNSGSTLTLGTVNAGSASLTSNGAMTLGTINATDTVTLAAVGGAISDGAGASVVADQLTISSAASADLNTNVDVLDASNVSGALTIAEASGPLTVANASATGPVTVSTVDGAMTVTSAASSGALSLTTGGTGALTVANASGTSANLSSGGAMSVTGTLGAGTGQATLNSGSTLTLGTVNAGSASLTSNGAMTLGTINATDTVMLAAGGGAIADGAGVSVVADQLTIASAGSADLNTNVDVLDASNVSGALTIAEASGPLTVANASATGPVTISTGDGAMTVTSAASSGALSLTTGGTGALTVANASGTSANLTSGGAMSVTGTLGAGTGVATLNSGSTLTLGTVNAGSASLTSNGAMTLGTINATDTVTLAAGSGAISDATPSTVPSIVANQLTITGAGSADLDTSVNILDAGAAEGSISGALTIRDQNTGLSVTNANATGAVNVSATGGTMTVANASSGAALTLASNGAGSVLDVTTASGASANLSSGGALIISGNTLNVSGAATLTSGGDMTLGTVNAGSATLTAGGAMTLGRVNVGTGDATLTAGGALLDASANDNTSLVAGNADITASSIGTPDNPFDTAVTFLTAEATSGGMVFREADDIELTSLTASSNQDIVVGTTGDITVAHIAVDGSDGQGRVLLAAGNDILAAEGISGSHITAQNIELRAGLNAGGGQIGVVDAPLLIDVPPTIDDRNGASVPSILLLQNASAADPLVAEHPNALVVSGNFPISTATFNPDAQNELTFLTTSFSTRTLVGDKVQVDNDAFDAVADVGLSTFGQATAATANEASNSQGEGTLYIDWASFDPNVSLFGTVNPPICLPGDQSDEEAEPADPAAAAATTAASDGCVSSTAKNDGPIHMPGVTLVISSRGLEWVRAPSARKSQVSVMPLISQR